MGRNKKKRSNKLIILRDADISKRQLTEIYAEAYYRALKRVELEKSVELEQKVSNVKGRRVYQLLFVLNVLLCPFKINKQFKYNNRLYDGLLTVIISTCLEVIGIFLWIFGVLSLCCGAWFFYAQGISAALILYFIVGFMLIFIGSFFFLSGKTFSEETESNRIYAFSASVLALVSCILSLVAMLKV